MLELLVSPEHLPLQLASRLLCAPGVWAPGSGLPLEGLGALVTSPLGWEWDGEAQPWEARPGGLVWKPPRRPLERYVQALSHVHADLPVLFTIAPDTPNAVERALSALEHEHATGFLLWDATPAIVEAGRRGGAALPLLAELPCTAPLASARSLVEAGADALWIGAPSVGLEGARLWGPSVLPLILAALRETAREGLPVPLIAGAGAASATDAQRLREAGAEAVALGPEWWVQPGLAAELTGALP